MVIRHPEAAARSAVLEGRRITSLAVHPSRLASLAPSE